MQKDRTHRGDGCVMAEAAVTRRNRGGRKDRCSVQRAPALTTPVLLPSRWREKRLLF